MAEKIHVKMMVNTIGLSPEGEKEMIERDKIALMKELMREKERHYADEEKTPRR